MTRLRTTLIVPDVHAPYHSVDAWELMLEAGRYLQPDSIVVMGDLIDCYAVSRHSKDPARASRLDKEVDVVRGLLDQLDSLGADDKVFIEGNHEHRLVRYIQEKAPELYGIFDMPRLLRLEERGWSWVSYRDHAKRGAVHYTHDTGHSGRYAVYRSLDVYQHSVATVHTHRMALVVEGNAVGEPKVSAQFGWLGDVGQVEYMHAASARKNWALGFGIGYTDTQTGHTWLTPIPILDFRCVVDGKLLKAPSRRKRRLKAVA
jgi:hypothetical protein